MKFGWSLALAALFVTGYAFAQDTTSEKGKVSYAIGYQIGSGLADRKMDVDIATVTRALQDAFAKRAPAVPEAAMKDALGKLDQKMKAEAEQALSSNKREADTFMASNRSKKGIIAGSYVTDGRITRSAKCRVRRGKDIVYDGQIATLKHLRDDVREVTVGMECGITFNDWTDFQEGDMIEAFEMVQVNA